MISATHNAGNILLILLIKNLIMLNFLESISSKIIFEIKNPDITKKISTPIKPPLKNPGNVWNNTTKIIDMFYYKV